MADENNADAPATWLSMAKDELCAVERGLAISPPMRPWMACYHAQQASEKAIKAIIVSVTNNAKAVPRTHDLESLLDEVKRITGECADAQSYRDGRVLVPYATLTRYPNDEMPPDEVSVEGAEAAVAMAKGLIAWSENVVLKRSKSVVITESVMDEQCGKVGETQGQDEAPADRAMEKLFPGKTDDAKKEKNNAKTNDKPHGMSR